MATGGGDEMIAQRIRRITDVAEEPLEFLAPISGYAKMPLVSLEEAVEPLVDVVLEVQSHAYVAKQRCRKPADGLTSDESASIMLYTMGWEPLDECFYIVLNNILRSVERQQKLKSWYLYLKLFLTALSRLPPLGKIAYRGVKLDMSKRYITGETIVWWGFSSCTTTVEVLESDMFLGETGTRTLFTIETETARDIRKHSFFPTENEVLLMAATQFKVISSLKQVDLRIIQLRETRPPHPLLQPVNVISQMPSSPEAHPIPPTKNVPIAVSSPPPTITTEKKLPKPKWRNANLEKIIIDNGSARELSLSDESFTDEDMLIVAYYALQENKTLTTLYLSNNRIGDEGVRHLSDALRNNTRLTTLSLNGNQIGNRGVQHLSDALRNNTTLTTLDLRHNQIRDKGTEQLAALKKKNKNLKIDC